MGVSVNVSSAMCILPSPATKKEVNPMKSIIRGKSKRFSLLEILLVVGIAVILLGILIPVLKRGNDKAKEVACINNLRNLSLAIQIYKNEFGAYPHGDLSTDLYKY